MSSQEPSRSWRLNRTRNSNILHHNENNITPLQSSTFNIPHVPPTPFTPYGKRGLSLHRMQQPTDDDTSKATKKLKRFLKMTWSIHYVSPLFNWRSQELDLKRYGRSLKNWLIQHLKETDDFHLDAVYETLPDLWLNDLDQGAFEVTVSKVSKANVSSVIYSGIFLSWGADENFPLKTKQYQPILLCRASSATMKKVHAGIERMHDCTIRSFAFRDEDLHSLTVGMLSNDFYEASDVCKMEFSIPNHRMNGIFEMEIPIRIISRLWSCIHKKNSSSWTLQEVHALWEEVFACTGNPLGLSLRKCLLEGISLPDIHLGRNKIKAQRKESMHGLLSYLMGLSYVLESAAPSIGVQQD